MSKLVTITVSRKPLSESSVADNVQKWGCGAINIEDTRIVTQAVLGDDEQPAGRWPSNLVLSHQPNCTHLGTKRVKPLGGSGRAGAGGHGFQGQYVGGEKKRDGFAGGFVAADGLEEIDNWECVAGCAADDLSRQEGDGGTAARFFKQIQGGKDRKP